MKKIIGGTVLALLALLMLAGFLGSETDRTAPATLAAFAITVLLPAAGAGLLVRSHFRERDRLSGRKALLRRQTVDAEILRLAGEHRGRLTAVEVARELSMSPEDAKSALDALTLRDQAEIEVTDEGVLVYGFHDVRHLGGKHSAKGVLDA